MVAREAEVGCAACGADAAARKVAGAGAYAYAAVVAAHGVAAGAQGAEVAAGRNDAATDADGAFAREGGTAAQSPGQLAGWGCAYSFARLPLDVIRAHPENDYSMNEGELAELMASIEKDGLGQLPLVRRMLDGGYQMIAGHRRLECFRRLRAKHPAVNGQSGPYDLLPVNVIEGLDDDRASILLNVTNLVTRNLSQEERGARYRAIGRRVPAMRAADPSLRGVRTNEVIARIVTKETGNPVSEATVKRAIAAERRLRDAREKATRLRSDLTGNWQVEAGTGKIDPVTLKAISELPEDRQEELFVSYQREGLAPGALRARLKRLEPKTADDARRELTAAIRNVEDVVEMARRNVEVPPELVQRLHSLIDQL